MTLSCLAVEVVSDIADPALMLAGRGPWIRGILGGALPSAREWEASAAVLAVIGELLGTFDARGLTTIAGMHAIAMTGRVEGAADYPDLCGRLLGWATVSAAVYPQRLLNQLPGWAPLVAALPGGSVVAPPELREWATCLASALTHRARLSAEDVRTLTFLYNDDLPRLAAVLDTPL